MTPDQIRNTILKAIFSEEDLESVLTLKGGNALKLHGVTERQSQDLDFSIKETVKLPPKHYKPLFLSILERTFDVEGYKIINFKFTEVPGNRSDTTPPFWGGYKVEFSIIKLDKYNDLGEKQLKNINAYAESIEGNKKRIQIDLSFDEYTELREQKTIDGIIIHLYSPLMIIYEKIRASCQQLPGYPLGREKKRARDLYDIYIILSNIKYIDLYDEVLNPDNFYILEKMFRLKEVDIHLIPEIKNISSELENDYISRVLPQIPSNQSRPPFDFLFEYNMDLFLNLYNKVLESR